MPVFRVTSPDGAAYDVTAPDGASEQDALAVAQAHHNVLASFAANSQSNPAARATLAASTSPGVPSAGAPRQAACTAASYQCLEDGLPHDSCYQAEQHCNDWAYLYGNMPPSPIDHRLLSVFPNGSTVIIPQGYDAKPGPKLRGWGQPRNPQ